MYGVSRLHVELVTRKSNVSGLCGNFTRWYVSMGVALILGYGPEGTCLLKD